MPAPHAVNRNFFPAALVVFYIIEWDEAAGRNCGITPCSSNTRHIPRRGRPATDFVGIDQHKTSSQICFITEDGEFAERWSKFTKANFDEVFGGRSPVRVLV